MIKYYRHTTHGFLKNISSVEYDPDAVCVIDNFKKKAWIQYGDGTRRSLQYSNYPEKTVLEFVEAGFWSAVQTDDPGFLLTGAL